MLCAYKVVLRLNISSSLSCLTGFNTKQTHKSSLSSSHANMLVYPPPPPAPSLPTSSPPSSFHPSNIIFCLWPLFALLLQSAAGSFVFLLSLDADNKPTLGYIKAFLMRGLKNQLYLCHAATNNADAVANLARQLALFWGFYIKGK